MEREGFIGHVRDYAPRIRKYSPPAELTALREEIPNTRRLQSYDNPVYAEKRDQLKARALKVTNGVPNEVKAVRPTQADYERLSAASDVERFRLGGILQSRDSGKHNRAHLTTIAVMAGNLAAEMTAGTPDFQQQAITGAVIDGYLHDILRWDDQISSVVHLEGHGMAIARRLPKDLSRLRQENSLQETIDDPTIARMHDALYYHDTPRKAPLNVQGDPIFKAVVLADSLAMLRYLTHRSSNEWMRNISEYTIERKLLQNGYGTAQIHDLAEKYTPVMAAFLLLSEECVAKKKEELMAELKKTRRGQRTEIKKRLANREYQVTGVLQAAAELGLLGHGNEDIRPRE